MPLVQQKVQEHFRLKPRSDLNPDEVVALGAGMLANLNAEDQNKFTDVLPMSIGVGVDSRFKVLLERNSPLPCSKTIKISIPKEKFETYRLDLYQGDETELHRNEY